MNAVDAGCAKLAWRLAFASRVTRVAVGARTTVAKKGYALYLDVASIASPQGCILVVDISFPKDTARGRRGMAHHPEVRGKSLTRARVSSLLPNQLTPNTNHYPSRACLSVVAAHISHINGSSSTRPGLFSTCSTRLLRHCYLIVLHALQPVLSYMHGPHSLINRYS